MILSGWKQIAKHTDSGVRTVQRWERDGLPVIRPTGKPRTHVMADSELLVQWLRGLPEKHRFPAIPKDLHPNIEQSQRLRAQARKSRQSLRLQLDVLEREVAALRFKHKQRQSVQ